MTQTKEGEITNKVSNKDWLEVSKGLEIHACIESHSTMRAEPGQVFTKMDFDQALKKVSRRVKK